MRDRSLSIRLSKTLSRSIISFTALNLRFVNGPSERRGVQYGCVHLALHALLQNTLHQPFGIVFTSVFPTDRNTYGYLSEHRFSDKTEEQVDEYTA